jgi:hypothetical protein
MKDNQRGQVYTVHLVARSGPPRRNWVFEVVRLGQRTRRVRIPTDIELWCETIVAEVHRKLRIPLGAATIVPSEELTELFSNSK